MTDLRGAQEEVRSFCERHDLVLQPEHRALDLVSEVGEVAKEILESTGYGSGARQHGEEMEGELGDAAFSLLALASELDVDLERALRGALAKYRRRMEATGDGPGS